MHSHSPLFVASPEGLSLAKCRESLGSAASGLSDDELLRLCVAFYALAEVAVDAFQFEREAFANVEREDRYDVEERAAILQFDAGATRGRATAAAVAAYDASKRRKDE
jgi:hypothetical protein